MEVFSGGLIDGATISSGLLELQKGASAGNSTITFAGVGTLRLDGTGPYGLHVTGFAASDAFDLSAVDFATAALQYSGDASSGTLALSDGTNAVSAPMIGSYSSGSFSLGAEPGGTTGTVVTGVAGGGQVIGGSGATAGLKEAGAAIRIASDESRDDMRRGTSGRIIEDLDARGEADPAAVELTQLGTLAVEPTARVASSEALRTAWTASVAAMVGPSPSDADLAAALFVGGIALPGAKGGGGKIRKGTKLARRGRAPVVTFDLGGDRFEDPRGAIVETADLPPVIETTGEGVEWTLV